MLLHIPRIHIQRMLHPGKRSGSRSDFQRNTLLASLGEQYLMLATVFRLRQHRGTVPIPIIRTTGLHAAQKYHRTGVAYAEIIFARQNEIGSRFFLFKHRIRTEL